MENKPRIIVVGGGAGGLELVTRLGKKLGRRGQAQITLVDKNPTHIWKPLLHEVATGILDQSLDEVSYLGHAKQCGYHYQLGSLAGLDRDRRCIRLAPLTDDRGGELVGERKLDYDYLVLALGSVSNDFGIPGVTEHCHFLDSAGQAEAFRHHLLETLLRHGAAGDGGDLSVAIVGAGATGTELSAELLSATEMLSAYGFTGSNKGRLQVHLIEAAPRILPALPPRIGTAVRKNLEKLGVTIHTETQIARADKHGFYTAEEQFIEADLCVWAAGIRANRLLSELGLSSNRRHQIEVEPTLTSVDDARIFAIGDCAACPMANGQWVPPRAQAAHQMASKAYRNLLAALAGRPLKPFVYRDFGSLISLSSSAAVGTLMGGRAIGRSLFVEGKLAKLFYISLYRMHQRSVHGSIKMLLKLVVDGINSVLRPRLKLH